MCRQASFPPGFSREDAINLLRPWATFNNDGTGSVHLKDGEFVVKKWAVPLGRAISKGLLDHMPHDGWTIVHLRAATHGDVAQENTHPFVKGPWVVAHNGIWSEHSLVRAALGTSVTWEGKTDSEVAAQLLATAGPKRFAKLVDFGGVFLALKKDGELWVVKTSGDIEITSTPHGTLVASTLEDEDSIYLREGWYRFDTKGDLVDHAKTRPSYSGSKFYGPLKGADAEFWAEKALDESEPWWKQAVEDDMRAEIKAAIEIGKKDKPPFSNVAHVSRAGQATAEAKPRYGASDKPPPLPW